MIKLKLSMSDRRPPPPPPIDDGEPVPPPLPSRTSGASKPSDSFHQKTRNFNGPPTPAKNVSSFSREAPMGMPGAEAKDSVQQKKGLGIAQSFRGFGSTLSVRNLSQSLNKSKSFGRKVSAPSPPSGLFNWRQQNPERQRSATVGPTENSQIMQVDDTYEEPAIIKSNSELCLASNQSDRLPPPPPPSHPTDVDSDVSWDSDFDDVDPQTDPPDISSPGSDDYMAAEGGTVPVDNTETEYNLPDEVPIPVIVPVNPPGRVTKPIIPVLPINKRPPIKPPVSSPLEEKPKKPDINTSIEPKPKPPAKPSKPTVTIKPTVTTKPMKPPDVEPPVLPTSREKSYPGLPPELKRNSSHSDDNNSSGSVSSLNNHSVPKVPSSTPAHSSNRVLVFPIVHDASKMNNVQQQITAMKDKLRKQSSGNKDEKVPECEIYDDAVSESLSGYNWYHGVLGRQEGAKRVERLAQNGAYLIRASKASDTETCHPYTLVVIFCGKVYNLMIRKRVDNMFAIGTYKADEKAFSSVPELVEYHKVNNIKLAGGGTVKLTQTPPN